MKKQYITSKNIRSIIILLTLAFLAPATFAADYYWRAVAANDDFNNIGNWETAPGNGVTPAQAPGPNDDVYFPGASNQTFIQTPTGSGTFRNLFFTAPANYTFYQCEFDIYGSISANGNLTVTG
ncbi:MAG: hypothetical protein ACOCYO_10185, partial [Bacteroidota bacterium]